MYQEVLSEVKSLVKLLANYNFTIPEVGYEATAENSEIIAEFELAWPDIFVGLSLVEEQQINGWQIFNLADSDGLIDCLRLKFKQ